MGGDESELEIDNKCFLSRPAPPPLSTLDRTLSRGYQASLAAAARAMFSRVGNNTYWIGAEEEPCTIFEQFAKEVFWHHVTHSLPGVKVGSCAGAEYWVQIRSPTQAPKKRSINWHYDKDEFFAEDFGIMIHPQVATATYLCAGGAPLVVTTRPILDTGPDGASIKPPGLSSSDAFIVYPAWGRHVAFRGAFLHGCPAELEGQSSERISVLVNIWLFHKPLDIARWRRSSKLSKELASTLAPKMKGGRLSSLFRPGPGSKTLPTRAPLSKDDASNFNLPAIPVGPWEFCGLRLPKGLQRGVWAVRQPKGRLSAQFPPKPKKVKKASLKRPASSASAASTRQKK